MDLRSALSRLTKEHSFISLKSLEECMTKERIKDHMSSCGVSDDPEVIFARRRLFAILILLECEKDVNALLVGIKDDNFFYFTEKEIPWKPDDSDLRAKFFELQSQFPPVLTCTYPPQKFPSSFRPPITEVSDTGPSGSFGVVRRVKIARRHLPGHRSDEFLAWKRIDHRGLGNESLEEVKTLTFRQHEHLVPLVACYSMPEGQSHLDLDPALHLFFPWTDTDMFSWMNPSIPRPPKHPAGLEEPGRRKEYVYNSILSVLSGASYLHREVDGLYTSHHDLKPQNIMLFDEQWKICDFGKTRLRSVGEDLETERNIGSFIYRPPEYEDRSVKTHGRAFDIWSLGCIIVELAVLIVYGWEGRKLSAFETERINNRSRLSENSKEFDASFHNNMPVVRRWMKEMACKDGSKDFRYLMRTASTMLSMDRDARPYSWEAETYLLEQLRPGEMGHERRTTMMDRIQAPQWSCTHNPLLLAIGEGNLDFVECLYQKGWSLGTSGSLSRSMNDLETTAGDVVSLLENYMPPLNQIEELFKRTYQAQKYRSDDMADKGHRDALAQKFEERVASVGFAFRKIKHILESRCPLDVMKIPTEETNVNRRDYHQRTALFWASWGLEVIIVDILLRYGAEVNPINKLAFKTRVHCRGRKSAGRTQSRDQ